jgi:hypothetical protein
MTPIAGTIAVPGSIAGVFAAPSIIPRYNNHGILLTT